MIRADLHIHTVYSGDSSTSLKQVIARCLKVGINCIAITDHNTIAGALEMKRIAPFQVIVGSEIETSSGEVIGYFLSEEVPRGLPAEETVRMIKGQGGLVGIPHPFDRLRSSTIHPQTLMEILSYIDIIEVLNSRLMLHRYSIRAEHFAREHGLHGGAGSDAHTPGEIGNACVEMPRFNGRDQFLTSLAQGRITGHRTAPWTHLLSTRAKIIKALKGG